MRDKPERFTVWHGLLLAEVAAVLIALFMPITPSKTGSDRGLVHLFLDDPSYAEQVLVYFALVNILLGLIGAGLWVWLRLDKN